ncbi:MAG TPA: metallophosphoesterase [Ignavibacteriaceae bacterium]|nr:metallophosphoesterase [Ignavibacteriaceae bacterium]
MLKKIVHISDLHFGTVERKIAEAIIADINTLTPDLVVVSGDLTQRARKGQFRAAKEFLDKLNGKKIIIPGNHDIPLFNLFMRFLFPLTNYKNIITRDLFPFYQDETMAVLGINSARSLTWKSGRISMEQIDYMKKKLCTIDNNIFKIIVTHHPFIPPPGDNGIRLVGRSAKALHIMDKCSIDLLLAGHLHQGYSGDVRPFYPSENSSIISAQAGTAISNRIREEPNGFNFIRVNKQEIFITMREWDGGGFKEALTSHYIKDKNVWGKEK